jgi:hypothetical protein
MFVIYTSQITSTEAENESDLWMLFVSSAEIADLYVGEQGTVKICPESLTDCAEIPGDRVVTQSSFYCCLKSIGSA